MKKFLITLSLALTLLAALPFASMAAPATSEAAEPGFFSLLYEAAGAHLAEILSALSAASAIAIAFCYKKGLLPILKNGIGAIGSATKKWGENAESYGEEAKKICENANNYIQQADKKIDELKECFESIEKKLAALESNAKENGQTRTVLMGQLDMLYDIFLSSSLPQFEKDRVTQRIERMKREIGSPKNGEESHA
ncbi:MAG: hypothetical protein IKA53_01270 [Clostridia bacterium]|nr:hypothetical protein [Clostridia bacterium]